MTKKAKASRAATVAKTMREVMTQEPRTVARAKGSPARKQKMRVAIALDKARELGAQIPKTRRPTGSGPYTDEEMMAGRKTLQVCPVMGRGTATDAKY